MLNNNTFILFFSKINSLKINSSVLISFAICCDLMKKTVKELLAFEHRVMSGLIGLQVCFSRINGIKEKERKIQRNWNIRLDIKYPKGVSGCV